MKILNFIILCYVVLTVLVHAGDEGRYDHTTYAKHTGKSVLIAWKPVDGATYYNLRAKHFEQGQIVTDPKWKNLTETEYVFKVPRGGHWVPQVQACKPNPEAGHPDICSDWSTSDDSKYATVDGVAKTWWVYGFVAPPTGGLE